MSHTAGCMNLKWLANMKLYWLAIFIILEYFSSGLRTIFLRTSDYFPPDFRLFSSGLRTIFLRTSDYFPPDFGLFSSGLRTIFLRTSDFFPPDFGLFSSGLRTHSLWTNFTTPIRTNISSLYQSYFRVFLIIGACSLL